MFDAQARTALVGAGVALDDLALRALELGLVPPACAETPGQRLGEAVALSLSGRHHPARAKLLDRLVWFEALHADGRSERLERGRCGERFWAALAAAGVEGSPPVSAGPTPEVRVRRFGLWLEALPAPVVVAGVKRLRGVEEAVETLIGAKDACFAAARLELGALLKPEKVSVCTGRFPRNEVEASSGGKLAPTNGAKPAAHEPVPSWRVPVFGRRAATRAVAAERFFASDNPWFDLRLKPSAWTPRFRLHATAEPVLASRLLRAYAGMLAEAGWPGRTAFLFAAPASDPSGAPAEATPGYVHAVMDLSPCSAAPNLPWAMARLAEAAGGSSWVQPPS